MTYWISSFIIHNCDKRKILGEIDKVPSRRLPETPTRYELFSREYCWSYGYEYFAKAYFNGEGWQTLRTKEGINLGEAYRTADYFLWEEEFDCSKDETIAYYKPSKLLMQGMQLQHGKYEGEYLDSSRMLACFDPSVNNDSFRGLLFRADILQRWLKENKMTLLWKVSAEKLVFKGMGRLLESGRTTYDGFFYLEGSEIVGDFNYRQVD